MVRTLLLLLQHEMWSKKVHDSQRYVWLIAPAAEGIVIHRDTTTGHMWRLLEIGSSSIALIAQCTSDATAATLATELEQFETARGGASDHVCGVTGAPMAILRDDRRGTSWVIAHAKGREWQINRLYLRNVADVIFNRDGEDDDDATSLAYRTRFPHLADYAGNY